MVPHTMHAPPPKGPNSLPSLGRSNLWAENAQYPLPDSRLRSGCEDTGRPCTSSPATVICDRMGHNSLHSCFEGTHGARCDTCLKELYYSYSEYTRRVRLRRRFAPASCKGRVEAGKLWRQRLR
jgi:hypothetical protein